MAHHPGSQGQQRCRTVMIVDVRCSGNRDYALGFWHWIRLVGTAPKNLGRQFTVQPFCGYGDVSKAAFASPCSSSHIVIVLAPGHRRNSDPMTILDAWQAAQPFL